MAVAVSQKELEGMVGSAIILDIRPPAEYTEGHISGAANARCGSVQQKQIIMAKMPRNSSIVIIDGDGSASRQNAEMMAQFGFDAHYLEGGMTAWNGDTTKSVVNPLTTGSELWERLGDEDVFLLDVREPEEYASHKIKGAVNMPLARLFESGACDGIPKGKKIVTICSHGNRSMIATFALAKNGRESTSLDGGMAGWSQVLVPKQITGSKDARVIQVEKVGKGCLSYVIAYGNSAMVIDAAHPVHRYTEIAKSEGLEIVAVADTHCHADHISASRELAAGIGAKLYLSSAENYDIQSEKVSDGDTIDVGSGSVRVMAIPGHTAGSLAYVIDGIAFCGDTVFADGVGRPDLHDTAEESARTLHDTLHQRLAPLGGDTVILPAHHAPDTPAGADGSYATSVAQLEGTELFGLDGEGFAKRIMQTIPSKPANYSMIIRFNRGSMPLNPAMIPDLEAGPNQCAVRA